MVGTSNFYCNCSCNYYNNITLDSYDMARVFPGTVLSYWTHSSMSAARTGYSTAAHGQPKIPADLQPRRLARHGSPVPGLIARTRFHHLLFIMQTAAIASPGME